ncbi:MFS transporter [Pluralibacter sp.]|uniref:MFS transporter n=1 Tax=Pluralibacter sp. TaxID=1920032 RepID=UPI0025E79DE3|nr:MFS transporter [Pluralibacter sp.]MBV8045377.1 MFS transporter [Pluralibacter sp.]
MNFLLFALLRALRCHAWLRLLAAAFIWSSLGNGLTQVVVFGQLLQWQASPALLTLAWLFATVPGFIGSLLGETLCRRVAPLSVLMVAEAAGMLALLIPWFGLQHQSIPALLMMQSVEALLGGITWPALALIFKQGLRNDELPAATAMESLIFASQVLLGTGIGVLLFDRVSPFALLGIDVLSFLLSLGLLWLACRRFPEGAVSAPVTPVVRGLAWATLSKVQKRSLLLLPALAAVGSPAMALLPALAQQLNPDDATGLALPLLFSRSLGQLFGPLLLNGDRLAGYAKRNRLLLGCLLVFLGAYGVLPLTGGTTVAALLLIFIAHLASNVVFALGTFSVLHHFSATEVASASARTGRWQTLSAALATGVTVLLAARFGAIQTLYMVCATAFALVTLLLARYRA